MPARILVFRGLPDVLSVSSVPRFAMQCALATELRTADPEAIPRDLARAASFEPDVQHLTFDCGGVGSSSPPHPGNFSAPRLRLIAQLLASQPIGITTFFV